jgi:hypothetical protein
LVLELGKSKLQSELELLLKKPTGPQTWFPGSTYEWNQNRSNNFSELELGFLHRRKEPPNTQKDLVNFI